MGRFRERYRLDSDRLAGWDYRLPAWYFVPICCKGMRRFFGSIENEALNHNEIGEMASRFWQEIPAHHDNLDLDEFVIMPNHLHGIVIILPSDSSKESAVETLHATSLRDDTNSESLSQRMSAISPKSGSLGVVIRSYKAAVTRQAREMNFPHFAWQRGYYDHIIRGERDLERVREYIRLNPAKWALDAYYRGGMRMNRRTFHR